MNEQEIATLMRGAAPAIEALLARAIQPLAERVAQLEASAAQTIAGVRSSVAGVVDKSVSFEVRSSLSALPGMVSSAVREAVSALPPAEPGKDADQAETIRLIEEATARLHVDGDRLTEAERQLAAANETLARIAEIDAAVAAVSETVGQLRANVQAFEEARREAPDVAVMLREAVAALPAPKDGESVDPETVRQMVSEEVAKLPPSEPGKSVEPDEVERMVTETVERTLAGWDKPQNGTSVTVEDVAPMIERAVSDAVAALPPPEPGAPGAPGKLGMVRAWEDRVFYEAEIATFDGAIYQALRDTGRTPPHEDWLCVVARGEPGKDAAEIEITGTFDVTRAYKRLNVVALNGGSFIAKRDDPGPCPGDGWQLVASQGNRGKPGDAVKGDPGRPGPAVRSIEVDDQGMLTLTNADGSMVQCDLYDLLRK